jgi:hypothetical protein
MHPFDEEFAAQDAVPTILAVAGTERGLVELVESALAALRHGGLGVFRISLGVVFFETGVVQDREDRPATIAAELNRVQPFELGGRHRQAAVRAWRHTVRKGGHSRGNAGFDGRAHLTGAFDGKGSRPAWAEPTQGTGGDG